MCAGNAFNNHSFCLDVPVIRECQGHIKTVVEEQNLASNVFRETSTQAVMDLQADSCTGKLLSETAPIPSKAKSERRRHYSA